MSSNTSSGSSKLFVRNSGRSGSMSLCFFLIIFYVATLFHYHQFSTAAETIDGLALLAIKDKISHDPLGVMSLWSSNGTFYFCNWHGITCGHGHRRVTKLDLRSSKLTGKRPTDDMFKEGLSLHSYVKTALPDQVTEIVDHELLEDLVGDEYRDTTRHAHSLSRTTNRRMMLEALISVLEIALACSHQTPQERLDMSNSASKLSSIKNKLLGTHLRQQRRNSAGMQG